MLQCSHFSATGLSLKWNNRKKYSSIITVLVVRAFCFTQHVTSWIRFTKHSFFCVSFFLSWYLFFVPERARWESNIHESHWNVNDSPMLSLLNNNNKTPRRNEKNKIYFDENLHLNQLNVKQIWWDLYSKKTNNVDERWLVGVCDYFCLMMIVFFISCLFSVFFCWFLN